ncbi:MAG: hypothetical protein IKZ96_02865 [Bacilli bacterium]|nr:hypothetical protein [Bacilli bacterium]
MTFSEYRAVMNELGIQKFKPNKDQKTPIKDKFKFLLDDFRYSEKYKIGFYYNFFAVCVGSIPTEVIRKTYDRIGRECFGRGDKLKPLTRSDLRYKKYIKSFRIGSLRDFLVFYDTLIRYYAIEEDTDELLDSIDVNDTYARIMSKLFETRKKSLSKTPKKFMNRKFKPFSLQSLDSDLDDIKGKVVNLLDAYDKAVNPLIDDSFEFGDIYNFAKRNDISISFDSLEIGEPKKGLTSYRYGDSAMSFTSDCASKEAKNGKTLETVEITHRFSKADKSIKYRRFNIKACETIEVTKFDKKDELISSDIYDLTKGTLGLGMNKHKITKEDLEKLALDLETALSIISERNKKLQAKTLMLECKEQK